MLPLKTTGWSLLAVLCAAVFAVVWWPGRTYFGFCHAAGRYVTDAEKINAGIDAALANYPPPLAMFGNYPPKDPIHYESREEFLRVNPNCCALTNRIREGQRVTFLSRLKGTNSTYVTVDYLVRFRDESGNVVSQPAGTARAVTNCGDAWPGY
jgi:hypothetical protein